MNSTDIELDATDPDEVTVAWQERAACLGIDPDLFFPERGASTSEAKAVCAGCTVREQCLDYALDNGETHGIWGGKSERERRRLRLRRRADRRAAEMGDVSHLQLATSADPK